MPTSLLTDTNLIIVVIAVTASATVKAWISLRKAHLREKSLTDRFVKALEGSSPQQRPAIIRAVGMLAENPVDQATRGGVDNDDPADSLEKLSIFAWLLRLWRNPLSAKD